MDVAESILDSIDEELSFDDDDVEMMEVEEGEVVDAHASGPGETHTTHIDDEQPDTNSHCAADGNTKITANNMPKKRRNKKKKKKRNAKNKMMPPRSDAINIDKFVSGVCKRLREHKSYLLYTAIGVLGVSALKDLLREVDAVQACGGQKTALGDRHRSGGGILWNILKTRDPNAYKEIMKKGRDFEALITYKRRRAVNSHDDKLIKEGDKDKTAAEDINEKEETTGLVVGDANADKEFGEDLGPSAKGKDDNSAE